MKNGPYVQIPVLVGLSLHSLSYRGPLEILFLESQYRPDKS